MVATTSPEGGDGPWRPVRTAEPCEREPEPPQTCPFWCPQPFKRRCRAKAQRNHNPRVGGSSPSSGTRRRAESRLCAGRVCTERAPNAPRYAYPRNGVRLPLCTTPTASAPPQPGASRSSSSRNSSATVRPARRGAAPARPPDGPRRTRRRRTGRRPSTRICSESRSSSARSTRGSNAPTPNPRRGPRRPLDCSKIDANGCGGRRRLRAA